MSTCPTKTFQIVGFHIPFFEFGKGSMKTHQEMLSENNATISSDRSMKKLSS
jgi:hypothetical protein